MNKYINFKENVWLYGLGGMGKTYLLRQAYKACQSQCNEAIWLEASDTFEKDLEKIGINPPKFIFIDCVNYKLTNRDLGDINALGYDGVLFFFTSRHLPKKCQILTSIKIDGLDTEEAVSLFVKQSGCMESDIVRNIVCSDFIAGSPLLIAHLARCIEDGTETVMDIQRKLNHPLEITGMRECLRQLYDLSEVTPEQRKTLLELIKVIGPGEKTEALVLNNKWDNFESTWDIILGLAELGWIERKNDVISLNPIVWNAVKAAEHVVP